MNETRPSTLAEAARYLNENRSRIYHFPDLHPDPSKYLSCLEEVASAWLAEHPAEERPSPPSDDDPEFEEPLRQAFIDFGHWWARAIRVPTAKLDEQIAKVMAVVQSPPEPIAAQLCPSCDEPHPADAMCPPHECRTTGREARTDHASDPWREKIDELVTSCLVPDDRDTRIESMRAELVDEKLETASLRTVVTELRQQVAGLEASRDKWEGLCGKLTEVVEQLGAKNGALKAQLAEARDGRTDRIGWLRQRISAFAAVHKLWGVCEMEALLRETEAAVKITAVPMPAPLIEAGEKLMAEMPGDDPPLVRTACELGEQYVLVEELERQLTEARSARDAARKQELLAKSESFGRLVVRDRVLEENTRLREELKAKEEERRLWERLFDARPWTEWDTGADSAIGYRVEASQGRFFSFFKDDQSPGYICVLDALRWLESREREQGPASGNETQR